MVTVNSAIERDPVPLYGIGTMSLISPTSLVFPALTMVNVSYKAWLKFIMPFVIGLLVPGALFFSIGIVF